jgi:hypothetical protein
MEQERYINPYTDFGFKKLFDQAEIAQYSPEERREYEASIKNYWDYYSTMKTAVKKGREEGRAEGRADSATMHGNGNYEDGGGLTLGGKENGFLWDEDEDDDPMGAPSFDAWEE